MANEVAVPPFREVSEGGELTLRLHKGQKRVWDSKARFVFMLGSPQVGKTCLTPHWLHREIQEHGAGDYLAVTSTYDLFKLKMLPEFQEVFENILGVGRYWPGLRAFELAAGLEPGNFVARHESDKMWGRIILRSADAKAGLESATALAAVVDEPGQKEFTREAWEGIQRRLSLSMGKVLGTTTVYCINWVKHDIFDRWKAGDKDIDIIQVDALQNPAFPKEEYERARKTLPPWKFRMLYQGEYEKPAGLIYDAFNEAVCKIGRFPIPKEWLIFSGHDFGGANPAAIFYAQDPGTGYFYAFHEYLPQETKTVAEQVEEFKAITAGWHVIKRVGGSHQEIGWRGDYTAHGWPILEPKFPKYREVESGIEKVYALHKLNKVFIFDDLKNYLDEKLSYSRVVDENYNPTEKIQDKERYHLMDAERYILSDFTPETVTQGKTKAESYI
jgi:hypothetical protein